MVKNTLTVGRIEEGFVLDHIQAGRSMDIYKYLHLDKLDCCVAIIKNAKSNKMGKKDIMKIECPSSPSASRNPQRDSLQESSLHHFDRAGTGSCLRTYRS